MLARIASLSPARLIFPKRDFSSEIFISSMISSKVPIFLIFNKDPSLLLGKIPGLSYYTTDKELSDAFSAFGTIKNARIIRDPRTNRPKGFAFVNYASEVEAQKAVKAMDGRIFGGRLIFVEFAKSKPNEGET